MQTGDQALIKVKQRVAFRGITEQLLNRFRTKPVLIKIFEQHAVSELACRYIYADMKLMVDGEVVPLPDGLRHRTAGHRRKQVMFFGVRNKNIR